MIKPTVGRKVWFYGSDVGISHDKSTPFDATVIYVWSDTCVNLLLIDHAGQTHVKTSVQLQSPTEGDFHGPFHFATWMPYQMGQAKAVAAKD